MHQVPPESLIKDILFEGIWTVADRLYTEPRWGHVRYDPRFARCTVWPGLTWPLLQHGTRKAAGGAPPASLHPWGLRDVLGCFGTHRTRLWVWAPARVYKPLTFCENRPMRLTCDQVETHPWPSCSPDLTPTDFFLPPEVPCVPKQPKKSRRPQGCSEAGGAPPATFRGPCYSRCHDMSC